MAVQLGRPVGICVKVVLAGYGLVVSKMVPHHSLMPVTRPSKGLCNVMSLIVRLRLLRPLSMLCRTTLTRPLMSGLLVSVNNNNNNNSKY